MGITGINTFSVDLVIFLVLVTYIPLQLTLLVLTYLMKGYGLFPSILFSLSGIESRITFNKLLPIITSVFRVRSLMPYYPYAISSLIVSINNNYDFLPDISLKMSSNFDEGNMNITGNSGSGFTPNNNSQPPLGNTIYIHPDSSEDKGISDTSLSENKRLDELRLDWVPRTGYDKAKGDLRIGRYRTLSDPTLPIRCLIRPNHLIDCFEYDFNTRNRAISCIPDLFREGPLEFPWNELPCPNDPYFSYRLPCATHETEYQVESVPEQVKDPVWPGSFEDDDPETRRLSKHSIEYELRKYRHSQETKIQRGERMDRISARRDFYSWAREVKELRGIVKDREIYIAPDRNIINRIENKLNGQLTIKTRAHLESILAKYDLAYHSKLDEVGPYKSLLKELEEEGPLPNPSRKMGSNISRVRDGRIYWKALSINTPPVPN